MSSIDLAKQSIIEGWRGEFEALIISVIINDVTNLGWERTSYIEASLALQPLGSNASAQAENGAEPWIKFYNAGAIKKDAAHEFGHVLGLGHPFRQKSNPYRFDSVMEYEFATANVQAVDYALLLKYRTWERSTYDFMYYGDGRGSILADIERYIPLENRHMPR